MGFLRCLDLSSLLTCNVVAAAAAAAAAARGERAVFIALYVSAVDLRHEHRGARSGARSNDGSRQ